MITKKITNLIKFFYHNPPHLWSWGYGKYAKHLEAIDAWIKKYSSNKGIYISNRQCQEYPEVTGYFIETLLKWGYNDIAKDCFNWLLLIQNTDGGWPDLTLNKTSVFFDSAQIIRGIKCYSDLYKINASQSIKSYLSYFSKNKEDQLLPHQLTITGISWYFINLQAAWIVNKYWPEYISVKWLHNKLKRSFDVWSPGFQNSHFDIYILEAMHELQLFPDKFNKYITYFDNKVSENGLVPCDRKNQAPCYTASAQLGVLYYKLGRRKEADMLLFRLLQELDIDEGNWTGSGIEGNYMQNEQVSWTLKYFLDMLYYHCNYSFDLETNGDFTTLGDKFHEDLLNQVKKKLKKGQTVLDAGCGLGRYINELAKNYKVFGFDISENNVKYCRKKGLKVFHSSLSDIHIPEKYPKKYDLIYLIEAFEHAIFPQNVIAQLKKYLCEKGRIIIIDKYRFNCLHYRLCPFERYYTKGDLVQLARKNGLNIMSFIILGGFFICEMI